MLAPLPPSPSSTWGGLEILESLGRGGFGSVYRARDPALDREVALNLIVVPSRDPARVGEVLREGRLLARIRHPNVVMVHAAQEHQGVVGIWMEFVQGRTLAEIYTHDLDELITGLHEKGLTVSPDVNDAVILTSFAAEARYPRLSEPVMLEEYQEALRHAKPVVSWAERELGE